jgi:hypothetical protein
MVPAPAGARGENYHHHGNHDQERRPGGKPPAPHMGRPRGALRGASRGRALDVGRHGHKVAIGFSLEAAANGGKDRPERGVYMAMGSSREGS